MAYRDHKNDHQASSAAMAVSITIYILIDILY